MGHLRLGYSRQSLVCNTHWLVGRKLQSKEVGLFWKAGTRLEVAQGQVASTCVGTSLPISGCPATERQGKGKPRSRAHAQQPPGQEC